MNKLPAFLALAAVTALAATSTASAQSARTWSSTPADGDWNDVANWTEGVVPVNNDRLVFGSSSTTTLNNDISGLILSGSASTEYLMYFQSGASSYAIGGNAITLMSSATASGPQLIRNDSTATQTIGNNLTLNTANGQSADFLTTGDMIFNGNISVGTAADFTLGMASSTARTMTFNGTVTLSTSNGKGLIIGGNLNNPGGIFTFNNTISGNKTLASTLPVTVNSGTTNLNASTSLASVTGARTLNLMAGSSTTVTGAAVNINDAGAFDEFTVINILRTGAADTGGSNGTASLLVGGNGWVTSGSINIGTNTNASASIVLGGKSGLGASGTATFNGNITALDSTNDRNRSITLTAAEGRVNFNGVISTAAGGASVLSISKTGAGIVALAGANTYAGSTTVSAGTLLLNNTAGSATGSTGALAVNGARLAGFGSTASATTIASGGRVTAGDFLAGSLVPAIDTLIQGNNTLAFSQSLTIDGAYDWYLGAGSTSAGFTQLDITGGNLALGGTSSFTLASANFQNGLAPDQGDLFWSSNHTWVIADVAGGAAISGSFAAVDFGAWSNGSFSLSTVGGTGNDLTLTWTAVPEPGAAALAFLGLSSVAFGARRRGHIFA